MGLFDFLKKKPEAPAVSVKIEARQVEEEVKQRTPGELPMADVSGYVSPSGGFVNYGRFRVSGTNASTGRKNTKRYEVAYDIINDKYKNLRNLTRNLAQKILSLRDEDSLEADFKRITEELQRFTEDREERIRKLSKMEGRLKELTGGDDIDDMIDRYNHMVANLAMFDSEIDRIYNRLMKLYSRLGIEPTRDRSINFAGIDEVPSIIMRYEKKLAANESSMAGHLDRERRLKDELHQAENDISENESLLYSIQTQDIKELEKVRRGYIDQIESMRYAKDKDKYSSMSYDEVVSFSRVITAIDAMIQGLYDEYGQLVSEYFNSESWSEFGVHARRDMEQLHATIQTSTAKRDQLYQKILEKNQYQQFQNILDKRPKTCTIDSCPFIATALKWEGVALEVDALKSQYQQASIEISAAEESARAVEAHLAIHEDGQKLVQYLLSNEVLICKYFGLDSLKPLYKAIGNGTWGDILDIMALKELASILSEKELYLRITMQLIPDVDHSISLAKAHGTNRDLLTNQLDRLQHTREFLKNELAEIHMHTTIGSAQHEKYRTTLDLWKEVYENITRYRELMASHLETQKEADGQNEKIGKIKDMLDKCKEQKHLIRELDDIIRDRTPKREKIKLDLDAVDTAGCIDLLHGQVCTVGHGHAVSGCRTGQGTHDTDLDGAALCRGRIALGLTCGIVIGAALAALTCASPWADRLLSPAIRVVRAAPVASFILLVLLWTGRNHVPAVISAAMVVPVVWDNLSRGIQAMDRKLLELAQCYRFSRWKTVTLLYLPALRPYILTALTTATGLAWKSGVAAEVLCLPEPSLGQCIYYTKYYLDIPELFAWTAATVALSMVLERLLRACVARWGRGWGR